MVSNEELVLGKSELTVENQQTLRNRIGCTGVGLHSGDKINMSLMPGAVGSGIVFRRAGVRDEAASVRAHWRNVTDTTLCTTLGNAYGTKVATVEHLMAALAGCGIDNAVVELDGPEVPIMDGSAAPFVFLIECAGVVDQEAPRRPIRVLREIEVREGKRWARLSPAEGLRIDLEIDYDNPLISRQVCRFTAGDGAFKAELSRSRTFGFAHEIDALHGLGLARGASLDNAVVVSGDKVLNASGLRYRDEFVRHKVLDSIGDLYLAGTTLKGHLEGFCSGHALNHRLLRELFETEGAWCSEPAAEPDADEAGEIAWTPPLAATA